MNAVVLAIMLLWPAVVFGVTYTVSPLGSDSAAGSDSAPWRSVQHAANIAVAGDTVTILPGVYAERVVFPRSGSVGAPITFVGVRGDNAEWLTVIDGSLAVTTSWVAASEVGEGVYKATLGYEPAAMTANNLAIWRIGDRPMSGENRGAGTGFQALARGSNEQVETHILQGDGGAGTPVPTPFWSGVEALFGVQGDVTYIRFKDKQHPATMAVRAARTGATLAINNKHFITLRNLKVQGGQWGVHIRGGSESTIIDQCYLTHGQYALLNEFSTNTHLTNSTVTFDGIGMQAFPPGDWNKETAARIAHRHQYNLNKFLIGDTNTDDSRVVISDSSVGFVATGNRIYNSMAGITFYGSSSQTIIGNNQIFQHSDNCIYLNQDSAQGSIYRNLIYDCDHLIRLESTEGVLQLDIYANRFYQPWDAEDSNGKHIFTSTRSGYPSSSSVRVYHNTFAGAGWSLEAGCSLFPFIHARNNLMATRLGVSSCNSRYGTYENNQNSQPWPSTPMPTFILPVGHAARNSAPSLIALNWPGMTAAYYGDGQADYGAMQNGAEEEPPPVVTPPPPAGSVQLGAESTTFTLAVATTVRYGADSRWVDKVVGPGRVECGNEVFGDPAYGVAKKCFAITSVVVPPPPPPVITEGTFTCKAVIAMQGGVAMTMGMGCVKP